MTEHASGKGPTPAHFQMAHEIYDATHPDHIIEAIAIALSDAYERGRRDGIEELKRLERIAIAAECLADYITEANEGQIEMVEDSYSFQELKRALSAENGKGDK